MKRHVLLTVLFCCSLLISLLSPSLPGAVRTNAASAFPDLPPGFAKVQLAHGLNNPTVFAFAPNGDIYIGLKPGVVEIYRNGGIVATPVISLTAVESPGEQGLLGLALDPNFATNGYMYLSYTNSDTFARLSRFTVVNGVANPSSEVVLLKGNQIANLHHNANDLQVGPDGKLWWTVGDNVPSISNAQTLTNIYGKILRINLDGTIPSDNPFIHVPGAVPAIYAYGLRNPYRFTFLPNGKVMEADTGSSYWEELNTIQPGGNYGWDFYEGDCFSCGYINPTYAYGHIPTDGAISAIAAYSGSVFPKQYDHVVFFGDYQRRDIEAVTFDPTYSTEVSDTVFDNSAGTIADLQEGPDGDLYYVDVFENAFYKIYPVGPFPPTAAAMASPNAGLPPLNVQFSSAGSTDPYGLPLTYSWDFGDGSPVSTQTNPSHTYAATGTYTATLTVSNGTQTGSASTQVVVGHTPPSASITSPAANATYNGGDSISFSGTATDAADGTLPASAYTWQVDFITNGVVQPFYNNEVAQPFFGPVTGVTSGSFQIPRDVSNTPATFYRITMTVVDSLGLQTVVTRDIHPNVTNWSVNTNIPNAAYVVDGTWQTSPYAAQDVVGVQHVLAGVPTQTIGAARYRFHDWADGSAFMHTITSTASGGSYTADYDQVQSALPSPWQSVDVGSPLMAGTADYSANDQTFYVDGSGYDVWGTHDQFHYVYQPLIGNGTIIARVRYQTNSDPSAKAGLMIKQSTATGAAYAAALVTPNVSSATPNANGVACTPDGCAAPLPPITPPVGNGVKMQWNFSGSKTITSTTALAGYNSPNQWLKLQRSGNTFTASYSTDGQAWTQIASTSISTMTVTATVGLFVTSHDIGQYSTAAFDNVQVTSGSTNPLPAPWQDGDIGSPAIGGSASYANGVFTVNAGGNDIWGTSDQFHYVWQSLTGDHSISARVSSQTNTSSNAKAGVMLRQSTDASAPFYDVVVGPPGTGIKVQYRATQGGTAATKVTVSGTVPAYLKVASAGGTYTAYTSSDGVTWTAIAKSSVTISMSGTVLAGLAVTSHNTGAMGTATFDTVSIQ